MTLQAGKVKIPTFDYVSESSGFFFHLCLLRLRYWGLIKQNWPVQKQWRCSFCRTWTGLAAAAPPHSACLAAFLGRPRGPESLPTPLCSGPGILSQLEKRAKVEVKRKPPGESHHRQPFKFLLSPPGRGFRIKSTTSFQSFFKMALHHKRHKWLLSLACSQATIYFISSQFISWPHLPTCCVGTAVVPKRCMP